MGMLLTGDRKQRYLWRHKVWSPDGSPDKSNDMPSFWSALHLPATKKPKHKASQRFSSPPDIRIHDAPPNVSRPQLRPEPASTTSTPHVHFATQQSPFSSNSVLSPTYESNSLNYPSPSNTAPSSGYPSPTSPPPYSIQDPPTSTPHNHWKNGRLSLPPAKSENRSRNRLRLHASTSNLANSLTGQLHAAATSCTNLQQDLANVSSGLYDRVQLRLCEAINDIDNEVNVEDAQLAESGNRFLSVHSVAAPFASSANIASQTTSANTSFSKVWLYANSRLPPHLPPLKVYMPTYPLLCLAAQWSLRVYDKPKGRERDDHIKGSLMQRTKAMTLKSLPVDDMNCIVFAIRGSSSFMDWSVNYRSAPASPQGFLDDPGNLCHAGFLSIAKGMIKPVAARLRTLLAENPSRSASSLVITGHSAGGAVAQLLYAHMLSTGIDSELAYLAGFFKRVHCVTFGSPPVALLPLSTPKTKQHRKSLFFNFINEGDPVARADPAVVRSLLKLYASPAPSQTTSTTTASFKWTKTSSYSPDTFAPAQPIWPVPDTTLSLGGRIVLMRQKAQPTHADDIEAVTVGDELFREVIYGEPAAHSMILYSKRVEILATQAVTVGGFSLGR